MGRPSVRSPSPRLRRALATVPRGLVLAASVVIVAGCVARAQGFEAWNAAWRAELSDRTGLVASIEVLDGAGPGAELASDTIRLRNLDERTIELAWLGGRCVEGARFSLAPEPHDGIALRYEIGPPCPVAATAGYALRIRFVRPIDSTAIEALPDWGP